MGYRLGVDLGTTFTAAVVHRPGSEPAVVALGDRSAAMPSVLYLGADGTVLIGDAAERRALTDPDRIVRRFKRRIGDETPLLFGAREGEAVTAHAVAARMVALVADRVAEREGGAADAIALTVPAAWGAHKKDLLTAALTREGLLGVRLVSEPAAVALAYAHTGRVAAGTTLAVYDFGGGTFDAALLRTEADGRSTLLGNPSGLPDLGGIDFDDAVLAHVLAGTDPAAAPAFDSGDPNTVTAMARLRRECVDAKEGLSSDTSVTVPVLLSGVSTSVRLTRSEFEAMIAAAVAETFDSLDAALESAGMSPEDLHRVLLTGGSSRIPLVTQLLSARYPGLAIERDIDPKLAVATGGVLALGLEPASSPAAWAADEWATEDLPTFVAVAAMTGPVQAAPTSRPERPALDREGFDRDADHDEVIPLVRLRRRGRSPLVLYVAAAVLVAGGFGISALRPMNSEESLPAASLQEQQVGAAKQADERAADTAAEKADAATKNNADTKSTADTESASTAGGRTEGSAVSRDAESTVTDASSRDAASAKSAASATSADRDQATAQRRAAKRQAATDRAERAVGSATRTEQAEPAEKAPTAAVAPAVEAVPADTGAPSAPAEPADTSTDSGSVETFNDGSDPAAEAPPTGP